RTVFMKKIYELRVSSMVLWIFIAITIIGILSEQTYRAYMETRLPDNIQSRIELLFTPENNPSTAIRVAFTQKSLSLFTNNPVIGVGWDNFRYIDTNISVSVQRERQVRLMQADGRIAHSIYLRIIAELGLL